ncbi:BrnA antitoxin family protein [Candidatus Dojkabacteria bacterium]|nr:BrnA antitoxin family protein [Candidatus Dojkabacteria bacterium]
MKKKHKRIPKFKNEAVERKFWEEADSSEYIDFSKLQKASFPNLRLSDKRITMRIPGSMLDRLKVIAHRRDIPYQSLIKQMLHEQITIEDSSPVRYSKKRRKSLRE